MSGVVTWLSSPPARLPTTHPIPHVFPARVEAGFSYSCFFSENERELLATRLIKRF